MRQTSLFKGDRLLTAQLRVCTNFLERGRGLLWRPPLQKSLGEGLLIPSCNAIHMIGMRYPISVLFLDRSGRVSKIIDHVSPWGLARCAGAVTAIETAVDTEWMSLLAIGDLLEW